MINLDDYKMTPLAKICIYLIEDGLLEENDKRIPSIVREEVISYLETKNKDLETE